MPFRHKNGANLEKGYLQQLKDVLYFRTAHHLPFTCHNSVGAEIPFLATLGIDVSESFHYCTMQMSQIINEILPFKKSLEECVKFYCDLDGKKDDERFKQLLKLFGWEGIPSEEMYEYASWDAFLHLKLWEAIQEKWKTENLEEYWMNHKLPTIPVANAMMNRGVKIDQALCSRQAELGHGVMNDIREVLNLNPGSSKDLKTLLIDKLNLPVVGITKTGLLKLKDGDISEDEAKLKYPSFDKNAMAIYDQILERRSNPLAQMVLEYRGWQKAVSSNYEAYLKLVSPDGRLRCNYKMHGTKSLRWSCEDPNLQQIPRVSSHEWNGKMKSCFIPEEEFTLIEGDYSQLEFRLGAAYGNEKQLLEIFDDATRDAFTEISERIGFPRYDTKQMIYANGYGAGAERIALLLNISMSQAQEMIKNYSTMYPGIRAMSRLAMNTAKNKKKVKLWSGRYRHFDHYSQATHKAFNAVVQGGAADIVEGSMQRLYRKLDSDDCRMLLQVHDSVVFAVRTSLLDKYKPEIKRVMEAIPQDFGVTFRVDVHKWGE